MLADIETGLVYRNPKPHVVSRHGYFPSVVALPDGTLVALYVLGQAFESTDLHVYVTRSEDGGRSWQPPARLLPPTPERLTTDAARLTALADGRLVAVVVRHDRSEHPEEGLANPQTLGFVPVEILLTWSENGGRSWSDPECVEPPMEGPAFELCAPITVLDDGRWLWPTSTWRDWHGRLPNGNRTGAMVSDDGGRSWPRWMDAMTTSGGHLIFWESKIVQLPDRRLLAVAWCYDEQARRDRPNHFSVSGNGGADWTTPASMGLSGQTMTPLVLDDGRVLCFYRRTDRPGLWANLGRLDGDRWVNLDAEPLWGHQTAAGRTVTGENMVENFHALKFGAPSALTLPDGRHMVVFWCYEDGVSVIRWYTFRIGDR
ncbi:MAG: exo-alpha-sialidase [Rhodopirellula sp.]|nr:exo-alpha-sialidase [Rhodopirellula sp.]